MTGSESDLAAKFCVHLHALCQRAVSECGYRPSYFLQMLDQLGGLGAVRALLHAAKPAAGLTTLWEKRRLDLSVEAAVLQAPWSALFTNDEQATARKRLHDLGYKA